MMVTWGGVGVRMRLLDVVGVSSGLGSRFEGNVMVLDGVVQVVEAEVHGGGGAE